MKLKEHAIILLLYKQTYKLIHCEFLSQSITVVILTPLPFLFTLSRAIRYLSKLRQERVALIGDVLDQEGFDLALLQEVRISHSGMDLVRTKSWILILFHLVTCYIFIHDVKGVVCFAEENVMSCFIQY